MQSRSEITHGKSAFYILLLEVIIAREVLPRPQGIKGNTRAFYTCLVVLVARMA
jgi:hypothetical protein